MADDEDQRGREIEEFPSWMAVHAQPQPAPKVVAVSTGGASAVEEVGDAVPIAIIVAAAKVSDDTTTPRQSVCSNNPVVNGGSVEPSQSAAAAAPAPEQVTVAATPPAPPQQATYIPLMVPAASQQQRGPLHIVRRSDPTAAGRGFSCRECGWWFPTYQGLACHVAGHKIRRLAVEAARAERSHACKICGAEYPSGVSLGGHMRKHYSGKPIKRMRLGPQELALALPLQGAPPPAVEAPIAAPPVQVPPGCLRLFGVTIVQQAKEEGGGAPATGSKN